MNPILIAMLGELEDVHGVSVTDRSERGGVLTARVASGGVIATLICNTEAPPLDLARRGGKRYGAYGIADEGYGDWIKGDDASECAGYIVAWLAGRHLRRAGGETWHACLSAVASTIDVDAQSPSLAVLEQELVDRSSLQVVGSHVLESADSALRVELSIADQSVEVNLAGQRFTVDANTHGSRAAVVLGLLDGLSDLTDE